MWQFNYIKRTSMHPVFEKFIPFSGQVESGYSVDFVGVKTKMSYFTENHIDSHIENCKVPEFNEEYFEWIDVLTSVTEAINSYTMIELGAGWGRWISRAFMALKQKFPTMPYTLVGVEAEPTHFQWMKEHCEYNKIQATLINAAVNDTDGEVQFYTGKPAEWYGQCIGGETTVKAIGLKSILNMFEHVDLLDLDIQNFEFKVLASAKDQLRKVKRIHIGTHSTEVEFQLRELFEGWTCLNDYSLFTKHTTIYGTSEFNDGVQTWINPL